MIKRMPFLIPGIYILMFVVLMVVQLVYIYGNGINPLYITVEQNIRLNSISNLTFYGGTTFLFIVLFLRFWKDQFLDFKNKFVEYTVTIVVGFIGIYALQIIFSMIYQLFNIGQSENQAALEDLLQGSLFDQISLIVFAVFMAPLVEEMVFRFAIFRIGDMLFNPEFWSEKHIKIVRWITMVFSAGLFGLIHVASGDMVQIFVYAGMGFLLAYLYHRTNNILVPILAHFVLNGFVMILMFLI